MNELTPTGYSETEYQEDKGFLAPRCYLCKRKEGDKALCHIKEGDYEKLYQVRLLFTHVEITKDDWPHSDDGEVSKIKYLICHECIGLIEALGEKFRFMKFALEEKDSEEKML